VSASPSTPCIDAEAQPWLLARLRAGDEAAFEELVRRCGGRMLATARRLLPTEDDAREAVQDAFLAAFRGLAEFRSEAQLSTWLHRIVINAALMKLRARKRRPEILAEDLLPSFDERGGWELGRPSQAPSCQDMLERREARECVQRCIRKLPDAYRTVLVLRDVEEVDAETAARALGISAMAAKTRLHRARQALRTLIEREQHAAAGGRLRTPRARSAGNVALAAASER
jgi:RNA polymerase sigma-70 factor (ECF subfamily)